MPPKKKQKVSPPHPPVPKTVLDKIISVCGEIDKPSRQAIKKALANTYNYTNENAITSALTQGVKMKKLVQKGQSFYTPGSEPSEYEPEPKKWIPLPPDEKHREQRQDFHGHTMVSHSCLSGGFPSLSLSEIRRADNRSFYKFAFHLQELIYLYHESGDEGRAGTFQEALDNMLDLSGYEMEHCNTLNCTVATDKYGNHIGISQDDMGTDMVKDDVKCLRDIYGVGASTVSLIEEWIETGSMKRLENLRNEVDDTIREKVHYSLNFEDGKKDYTIDFVEALGKLADLYEEEEDHRATAFRRAIIALEPKIIHSVEDIETQKLIDLKGVGKSTLEMFKEFIETGKIEKLEEFRPKITKEVWDAFIENHEPLRQYFLKEELLMDFEEEYKVVITCGYHERELKNELAFIESGEYEGTPVYDIEKLKRSIEKYEFSLGDVHERYIFEGYIKHGDIKTHPFVISFEHDDYRNPLFKALGWTPGGLEDFLWKQLWEKGSDSWEERLKETKAEKTGLPFTFEYEGDKYKVDGDADDIDEGGACIGVRFDGAIYKNGVMFATVALNWGVDTFERDGDYCNITLDNEDNEEDLSGLEETCFDEFHSSYVFPDNMAYRE